MKCNLGWLFSYSEMLQETYLQVRPSHLRGAFSSAHHPGCGTLSATPLFRQPYASFPCLLRPLFAGEAERLLTPKKGPLATPNTRQSLSLLATISLLVPASRLELAINTQSASWTRAEFCGAWRIINLEALLRNMGGGTQVCRFYRNIPNT